MAKNRIFIEALGLVEGHFSGIGQYTLGVLKGMDNYIEQCISSGHQRPDIRVIITKDTLPRYKEFNFKYLRPVYLPFSFRVASGLFYRQKLPPFDLIFGPGTYLFTRFVSAPLVFSESATIIYDLSFIVHPEYSDDRNAEFLGSAVHNTVKRSKKIVAISDYSKKEIVNYFGIDANNVVVATPAAPNDFFYRRSQQEINKVLELYGLPNKYILTLSNLEPRKNLDTTVDAYLKLPDKIRKDYSLVLVGVNGWKADGLFEKIIQLVKNGENITRPSKYVEDKHKPALLSGATVLSYPSHYEGFGMPPLEALSCGTPAIVANNTSLPQAVGRVGTILKHNNSDSLAEEMLRHITSEDEIKAKLQKEGPKHSSNFSWNNSARVIIDTLEEIA